MPQKSQGRNAPGRFSFTCSLEVVVLIAAAVFINFAIPQEAQSQIGSKIVNVPFASSGTSHVTQAKQPKAPVQVEMPAPPPMKIFAGLNEPLVATGPVTDEEGKDLDAALAAFHDAPAKAGKDGDYDDYGKPLLAFIAAHPNSNWNAALYLNIGLGYYHSGYYSRVFPYLEKSWQLGRNATSPQAHMMIDKAVGEIAQMHAKLGHKKELEAVFADIGNRPIGGPATEMIKGAQDGLGAFTYDIKHAYLCGPKALVNVLKALKASTKQILIADQAVSGPHGYTLSQLAVLADKTKLKYTLIHRTPGQPIPVPAVIHWSNNHYAAVTGQIEGYYVVQDPTFMNFGGSGLTTRAIDSESSGYFLVPSAAMAKNPNSGWRIVAKNSAEAKSVYGMGFPSGQNAFCTNCLINNIINTIVQAFRGMQELGPPMTVATAQPMVVSLHMYDTPVGYAPQVGKTKQYTTIYYNQAEFTQPATFGFGNLSAKWVHNWQDYIQDDPTRPGQNIYRIYGTGGGYPFQSPAQPCGSNGCFQPEQGSGETLVRVPGSGTITQYTAYMPDGGTKVYTQTDGATSYPRRVFLTSITDPQGNVTTINYDSQLRITSIVDPMGRSTTFTYGLSAHPLLITKITDGFGRTTQMAYDTSARLSSITDPVGITSSYTYSTSDPTFVTNLTTPYGTSVFSETPNPNDPPNANRRSLTLTDPLGYMDYVYSFNWVTTLPYSYPTAQIPSGVGVWNNELTGANSFYWNKHKWAACVTAGGCSISGGVVQSEDFTKARINHWATAIGYMYDLQQNIKDPLEWAEWFNWEGQTASTAIGTLDKATAAGRVLDDGTTQLTSATYNAANANGTITSRTDPMGRVTQYAYASSSSPGQTNLDLLTVKQLTAPSTYTTIASYGSYSNHRPQTYTGADGQTWNYTWNSAGQLKTVTDPNSGVTTYNYDSTGRLSTIVNASSQTVLTNTYDSADRIQTQTDSQAYALTYAYDNIDRITSITYPDGTTDQYDYTFQSGPNAGTQSLELRKYTDRLGRVTTYNYDADQRLTSVSEPITSTTTRTTSYDYYEDGTLKDITDANGNVTHWDIDLESRPIDKIYAYGTSAAQTETYAWEQHSSRLHTITDALAQVKTFAWTKDNKLAGISYSNTVNSTPPVTFTWDTYFPRLTSMTDGLGTTNYSYTAIGTNGALKLSSTQGPFTNNTIGLTYDALGRLSGRNITGGNESFGYDAISRLNSHGTPLGSFTIGYLGQTDQVTSQSVTNGSVTVSTGRGYDTNTNDRRLISITNSGTTRSYTLGYGSGPVNVYDIQSITDTAATGHPWATQSHNYTNDMIDRLLTASATTPGNFSYGYDPLDNLTTVTTPSGTVTPAPTFNGLNQISTWGSNTYSSDANGNTLSGDGTRTYKWDAENRLIEIDYVGSSVKSQFSYDGLGHRTVDVETASGGGTTTTRYLWCPDRQGLSRQGASDGVSQAARVALCQTRDGSDNVLRRDLQEGELNVTTGQKLVYMPDQLGSVRDVLDASTGNLVQSYDYTPYGATARSSGSTPTDYQFAGLFYHVASGLSLASYRPYDGITGRWLTRDPIRERGGINLYTYVGANLITFIDPSGLHCEYSQSTGNMTCIRDGTGEQYLSCQGYAGNGAGLNNPAAQSQQNIGPLPTGTYTVGAPTHRRGPVTRPLTPAPTNTMYGRSGFLIHGDNPDQNHTASEGCIVAPRNCREEIPTGETLEVVP